MSSKANAPAPAQEGASPPDLFGVVELHGPDAAGFAQAQTMNDVRTLQDGQWQWNGSLNPKGRVIALFALLRLAPDRLWMLLPDVDAQAFAANLGRFVFRSKLHVSARSDLVTLGYDGEMPTPRASASLACGSAEHGMMLDLSGESRRLLWLAPRDLPPPAGPGMQPMSSAEWAVQDIAHGLPRLEAAMTERFTPQMLGLGLINAYSIRKGCYPGQEIVARTHFLGNAKRESIRLQADRAMQAGEAVEIDGQQVGIVACTNIHNQRSEAIAVIALVGESTGKACTLAADKAAAKILPFALGLAR